MIQFPARTLEWFTVDFEEVDAVFASDRIRMRSERPSFAEYLQGMLMDELYVSVVLHTGATSASPWRTSLNLFGRRRRFPIPSVSLRSPCSPNLTKVAEKFNFLFTGASQDDHQVYTLAFDIFE